MKIYEAVVIIADFTELYTILYFHLIAIMISYGDI